MANSQKAADFTILKVYGFMSTARSCTPKEIRRNALIPFCTYKCKNESERCGKSSAARYFSHDQPTVCGWAVRPFGNSKRKILGVLGMRYGIHKLRRGNKKLSGRLLNTNGIWRATRLNYRGLSLAKVLNVLVTFFFVIRISF